MAVIKFEFSQYDNSFPFEEEPPLALAVAGRVADMIVWLCIVCFFLRVPVFTLQLPETTYLPTDFTADSIRWIVEGLGLIYESYDVVTEDGYILNLNRIVNPDWKYRVNKGPPVLIVSGLFGHADGWFLQSEPRLNLPVRWLLEGYDVWLGDQRGSIRSIKHTKLSTWFPQYWDFSFHETGYYDLPAWIDFILHKTGYEKLAYSGLSDGGAFYYVLTTTRPEYQRKLYGGILWSPVGQTLSLSTMAFFKRASMYLAVMIYRTLWEIPLWPINMLVQHVFPFLVWTRRIAYLVCILTPKPFLDLITYLQRDSTCQSAATKESTCARVVTYFGGTSAKYLIHTVQLFKNGGGFRQYDYGRKGNMKHYNQPTPPAYDMGKLKVFTALYFSNSDVYVPNSTQIPFATQFTGPRYECEVDGVCHTFVLVDPRAIVIENDATRVLNQITGKSRPNMMQGIQPIQLPTFWNPVTKCNIPDMSIFN